MSSGFKETFRLLHQKRLIRAIAGAAVVMGVPVVGAYSYFVAPNRVRVDQLKLRLSHRYPGLKNLKIAQISDIHYGPSHSNDKHFAKILRLIDAQKPDLLVMTGDYYQWDPTYQKRLPAILGQIQTPLGTFGSFGNHDYGSCYPGQTACDPFDYRTLKADFAEHGIVMLANETLPMAYNNTTFNLVGLHDLWSGLFNPTEGFARADTNLATIVLSHNPDTACLVEPEFDLMLSGHSHGGQVKLPGLKPFGGHIKNKALKRGFHQLSERKHLYVNRGLGHNFKMRLGSPPEITLIEVV